MTSPVVTVLMPVYNGTLYLHEAIDSVLAQSYTNFELLIIDDASTDGSVPVIESYTDERIRLVRNESNIGQVATLNGGLELARGDYIARLDQDDFCLMTRLERQAAVLDSNAKIAVVSTWMQVVDDQGQNRTIWAGKLDDYADFVYMALTNRLMLYHPAVMYRRDVVLYLDGYDETVRYSEDQDLWRKMALAGYEARILPQPLTCYRLHEGQQSSVQFKVQRANAQKARDRFIQACSSVAFSNALRNYLEGRTEFWDEVSGYDEARDFAQVLELMLRAVRENLSLGQDQFHKFELLFRRHAARVAIYAWKGSIRSQLISSRPIFSFALHAGGIAIFDPVVWMYPLVGVLTFILVPLHRLKLGVLRIVHRFSIYFKIRSWGSARKAALLGFWYARFQVDESNSL